MRGYLDAMRSNFDDLDIKAPLLIMQSAGGLTPEKEAAVCPVFVLESGPAAGVLAAKFMGTKLGLSNLITFDMGGTTAKASMIEEGCLTYQSEYEVGASLSVGSRLMGGNGEIIRAPSIDIAEVGAGGGSIAHLDRAGGLHVGPKSAGAFPGPVCYQQGGQDPTVTDANVVLGFIRPGRLADGQIRIDPEVAWKAIHDKVAKPLEISVLEAAEGIYRIANTIIIRALREVSTERGRDPRDFSLIAFGGAGPIHAANLAEEILIRKIIIPPRPGLFSAMGLLFSDIEHHNVYSCVLPIETVQPEILERIRRELREGMLDQFKSEGYDPKKVKLAESVDMRFQGQTSEIQISLVDNSSGQINFQTLGEIFKNEHEKHYGHRSNPENPVEIVAVRIVGKLRKPKSTYSFRLSENHYEREDFRLAYFGLEVGQVKTPVKTRKSLKDGMMGPLLIDEYDSTIVVPPNMKARLDDHYNKGKLEQVNKQLYTQLNSKSDPVTQVIVPHALASAADQMALNLYRTAYSTIVRDCLDFSTSLCDEKGQMIAQGVTLPHHIASVPFAMHSLLKKFEKEIRSGDIFILNDPFDGGMHIPDIFIVQPIFWEGQRIAFAVTTAHHTDLGGRLPGSAACDNTEIFQEGLRIPWLKLYDRGKPDEAIFALIKTNVRLPEITLGDLRAQLAATHIGEGAVLKLISRYGLGTFQICCKDLIAYTERLVRMEIASWPDSSHTFIDYMDSDGIGGPPVRLQVKITVKGSTVVADFTGTDPQVRGGINCTLSFTTSVVAVCLRAVIRSEIPNTAGMFKPVKVIAPLGTVANATMPAASSMRGITGFRLSDTVRGALAGLLPDRVFAAGEGGNTLVIFGGERPNNKPYVYYELVTGTWGGRPDRDGNDGLCNPSSISSNVPIEQAECEFPVQVKSYGLVCDSGGAGKFRGGLAIQRKWQLLSGPANVTIRSDRRDHLPYGLQGGKSGNPSMNKLFHDKETVVLPTMISTVLEAGDMLSHQLAGGGGWGDPLTRDLEAIIDDVKNEKVSPEAARKEYGVVICESTGEVDYISTKALRKQMQNKGEKGS